MSSQATSDEVYTDESAGKAAEQTLLTATTSPSIDSSSPEVAGASDSTLDATDSGTVRIRMSRSSLMVVAFLAVCVTPLAISAPGFLALYAIPLLAAVWVLRAGVDAGSDGLTVRALVSSRRMPWHELAGLQVSRRGIVYALTAGAKLRLPVVRVPDLPRIAAVSGGRIQLQDQSQAGDTPTASAEDTAPASTDDE